MGSVKFCRDCKFSSIAAAVAAESDKWHCICPEIGEPTENIVSGVTTQPWRYCIDARADEALCGEQAKWFEAKA